MKEGKNERTKEGENERTRERKNERTEEGRNKEHKRTNRRRCEIEQETRESVSEGAN